MWMTPNLKGLQEAEGRLRGRIGSEKSVAISLQPAQLICNVNRLQSKPLFGWAATKSLSYKANYRGTMHTIRVHKPDNNNSYHS